MKSKETSGIQLSNRIDNDDGTRTWIVGGKVRGIRINKPNGSHDSPDGGDDETSEPAGGERRHSPMTDLGLAQPLGLRGLTAYMLEDGTKTQIAPAPAPGRDY